MAYLVKKTVNGIQYLYRQTSTRVGKQVFTKSQYIGRADGMDAKEAADRFLDATDPDADELITTKNKKPDEKSNTPPADPPVPLLTIAKNIDFEKFKISEDALIREHQNAIDQFKKMGLDTSEFAEIKVKFGGKSPAYRKVRFKNIYSVTLPRWRAFSRTQFKIEYSKAIATAGISLIKKQNPETYKRLKSQFKESYGNTQYFISCYICDTNDRMREKKLSLWNSTGQMPSIYKSTLKPKHLGLPEIATSRKNWEDDLIISLIESNRKGFATIQKEREKLLSTAEAEEKRAQEELNDLSGWKIMDKMYANQRIRRATNRTKSNQEMLRKLEIIRDTFEV